MQYYRSWLNCDYSHIDYFIEIGIGMNKIKASFKSPVGRLVDIRSECE
jgi:hypothetical protein